MLAPHPRNARRHSPKQIDQIAVSIESFGFNAPILIDANNQVLAGHGRLAAARKLGLEQVPTVRIEHLSERQRRGYMLADNCMGELSTRDETMLALELEELSVLDEPFEITATGVDMAKIDVLIEEHHKPKQDNDPADLPVDPASIEQVTRPGDLWLLGRHRLFVGSAFETESYKALPRVRRSPVRILCTREFQNSIRDSSKKLIEDCIARMGFGRKRRPLLHHHRTGDPRAQRFADHLPRSQRQGPGDQVARGL